MSLLYHDVVNEICKFIPKYKLLEWIDIYDIDWVHICANTCEGVMELIENNLDQLSNLSWIYLCQNSSDWAISILEKNPNKIRWSVLLKDNKNYSGIMRIIKKEKIEYTSNLIWDLCGYNCNEAIEIIEKNPLYINWCSLSGNPCDKAIDILEKNIDKICWSVLCNNTNNRAIDILEKNMHIPDIMNWFWLSVNPCDRALDIIEKNIHVPDRINWSMLSQNISDRALDILEKNIDKIDWENICKNTNTRAIKLIENYLENKNNENRIGWIYLCRNKNINVIDILKKYRHKVDYYSLATNPCRKAIEMVKKYSKKWLYRIFENPAIFEETYNEEVYKILMNI